jgi:hypothetical protein
MINGKYIFISNLLPAKFISFCPGERNAEPGLTGVNNFGTRNRHRASKSATAVRTRALTFAANRFTHGLMQLVVSFNRPAKRIVDE